MLAPGAAVGFGTMFQKQREKAQKAPSAIIWTGFRSRLDALMIIWWEIKKPGFSVKPGFLICYLKQQ
jgi:hypothetical protein